MMRKSLLTLLAFVFWFGAVSAQTIVSAPPPSEIVLGQSHIPFIMPSSATIGNNGALSGVAATKAIYTGSYAYFPSGAIGTGVAAGFYWTVWSSTTAGTIYNNLYVSGTPAAPASPTPFVTTGPGSYAQGTSTPIAAYQLVIPGNTVGANGSVQVIGNLTGTNDTNSKAFTVTLNGTPLGAGNFTSSLIIGYIGGFVNRGVTGSQTTLTAYNLSTSASGGGTAFPTIDTTVAQTLAVNIDITNVADTLELQVVDVTLKPGVP